MSFRLRITGQSAWGPDQETGVGKRRQMTEEMCIYKYILKLCSNIIAMKLNLFLLGK